MSFHRAARLSIAALLVTVVAPLGSAQAGPADAPTHPGRPGSPGKAADWAPGDKDGFGTSRSSRSKAWYTLNDGAPTESSSLGSTRLRPGTPPARRNRR
jgi:glucoamylase